MHILCANLGEHNAVVISQDTIAKLCGLSTRSVRRAIVDLAEGHLAALGYLAAHPGLLTVNLGTGRGYSVLEMVRAFERASGRAVPYEIVARRAGDIAACYADPTLAHQLLGWSAQRDLDAMCRDAWRWQCNPAAR